jgi:hypothetical protein
VRHELHNYVVFCDGPQALMNTDERGEDHLSSIGVHQRSSAANPVFEFFPRKPFPPFIR